jgi:glycosyltransferase involved in cell wall biosynthesis
MSASAMQHIPAGAASAMKRLRILTFSTLFPSAARPGHGIFVEQRLRKLVASGAIDSTVVAPVPWFPFPSERFGEYGVMARTPREETRFGVRVLHPRYPLLPRVGMTLAPFGLAAAVYPLLRRLLKGEFAFDLIDAHYYYPDGVAAALLGRRLGKPVVITARGTDINLIPGYRLPRRLIQWAGRSSAASIAVCRALRDEMAALGIAAERITVLRNGVDLETFAPVPKDQARARLGLEGPLLLSVGYLIERKGHDLLIRALRDLPGWRALIVGQGELRTQLAALARQTGVAERVHFAGAVAQPDLKYYYSAADALVLASSREGMANVLLESLACGTPVVATPLWGTPEVVARPEAGRLMRERSVAALVDAVNELMRSPPDPRAVRQYAEGFSWDATTQGQLQLFNRVLATQSARADMQLVAPRGAGRG